MARERRRKAPGAACHGVWSLSLVVYSVCAFQNGFYINSRGSYVATLANQTGSSISSMGSYFLACGIGGAVIALPVGWAVDVMDAHRVLITGLGIRALACAAVPFVTDYWELAVDTLAIGFTLPLVGVTLRACTLWRFGKASASVALNVVMGSYGSGSVLAPLLFGWLLKWDPLHMGQADFVGRGAAASAIINWCSVATCCMAMLLAGLLKSPVHDASDDGTLAPQDNDACESGGAGVPARDSSEALDINEKQCSSSSSSSTGGGGGGGEGDDKATPLLDPTSSEGEREQEPVSVRDRKCCKSLRLPMIAIVTVYAGLSVGAETTIGGWLVSYAQSTGEFSAFDANVLASVMWGIFTAARLAFASLVVCVHPGWILFIGHLLCLSSTLLLICVPSPASSAEVWIFTVMFGAGIATFFPNAMGTIRMHFNLTAFEQAWFSVAASVGNGLVPAIAGWLIDDASPESVVASKAENLVSGASNRVGGVGDISDSPLDVTGVCLILHLAFGGVLFSLVRAQTEREKVSAHGTRS